MTKSKFALGAIIGAVAGTAVGFLTAPKAGKETRAELKTKAEDLKKDATVKVDEFGQEVSKRAAEARAKAEEVAVEAKSHAEKTATQAKTTVDDVKSKVEVKATELKTTAEHYKDRGEKAVHGAVEGAKKGFKDDTK